MLNLLPPEIKDVTRVKTKVSNLVLTYVFVLSVIVIGVLGLLGYDAILTSTIHNKQDQLTTLGEQKKKLAPTAEKLAFIQDRLGQAGQYQDGHDWALTLQTLAADTPASVQLTTLATTADPAKGTTISLSGKSASRRDIILFQEKISGETAFSGANLTALASQADSNGQLTFSLEMVVK